MKALLEEESEKITIEEEIENQVKIRFFGIQVTFLLVVAVSLFCVIGDPSSEASNSLFFCYQRAKVTSSTPMTPELFMEWKKKKIAERDAGLAAQRAERAKNDRMR